MMEIIGLWHTDNIPNYSDGGNGWGEDDYDKAVL